MEQRIDQALSGVELQIWREESGEWRCQVLVPEPAHTVMLGDQAALSSYIAGQIDRFITEYELLSRAA